MSLFSIMGGCIAILSVFPLISFAYYSGMEQSGSSSGSCPEGREFKSHSPQYFSFVLIQTVLRRKARRQQPTNCKGVCSSVGRALDF